MIGYSKSLRRLHFSCTEMYVFLDESGFMLQPVCRRTWAPRGHTPILRQWDRRDRLSTISALTVAPRRRRIGLYCTLYRHNIRCPEVLRFLRAVRRHLPHGFTLIWDRAAHAHALGLAWPRRSALSRRLLDLPAHGAVRRRAVRRDLPSRPHRPAPSGLWPDTPAAPADRQ